MTSSELNTGTALGHYVIASTLVKDRAGITYIAMDTTSVSGSTKVRIREAFPEALAHRMGNALMAGDSESAASGFTSAIHAARHLAQILSRIEHPSIPRVRDAFELNGTHYTVLEEPDGETYASLLLKQGPLPAAQIKSLLLILMPALEALHAAGLVHGRLSATTIVRLDDGYPALTGLETASFNADASLDLRGLGETCDMLWTAGSGLTASGVNVAQDDLRLARAIQGAAGQAGAPPIRDIAAFRKLALKSAPLLPRLVSKPVLTGVAAVAITAAAAASVIPNLNAQPPALILERVQVVNGAAAPGGANDPFAVKAQTVSLRDMVETPAGLPATTPAAAWASLDRNNPAELRVFLEAFPKSDRADLASERLELLDERLWLAAERAGTRESYDDYLKAFATKRGKAGEHVDEAERAVKRFSKSHTTTLVEIRELLIELGYDTGAGQGETPALKRAIRRFEKDSNLKVTGEPTPALLEALTKAVAAESFQIAAKSVPAASSSLIVTKTVASPTGSDSVITMPVATPNVTDKNAAVLSGSAVSEPSAMPVALPEPVTKLAPPPKKIARTTASMPAKQKPLRYPARARDLGEQGNVVVKACVASDGALMSAAIQDGSGSARLDSAALDWVREHKGFKPATADGVPVDGGCFYMPVKWEIDP